MTPRRRVERQRPDRPPDLPLPPGPVSNGEFLPAAPSGHDRDRYRATLRAVEDAASRVGVDRRRFLQTAGGVAAALTVFNLAAAQAADRLRSDPAAASRFHRRPSSRRASTR